MAASFANAIRRGCWQRVGYFEETLKGSGNDSTELWQQVLVAVVGGVAAELFHWYVLARRGTPVGPFAGRPLYWATTIGMVLLGGVTPLLYVSGSANALLCFHLGATTPLLLAKLLSQLPDIVQRQGASLAGQPSFRSFISW
jgi:hypothetical protein